MDKKKLLRVSHKHKRTHKNTTRLETVGNSTRLVLQAGAFPLSLFFLLLLPFYSETNEKKKEEETKQEKKKIIIQKPQESNGAPRQPDIYLCSCCCCCLPGLPFSTCTQTHARGQQQQAIYNFFFHLVAVCSPVATMMMKRKTRRKTKKNW